MTHKPSAPNVEGFSKISFWREESVGVITLLAPGHIDSVMLDEMIRVLSIAAIDDKVSSVFVTGSNYIFSRGLKVPDNKMYADFRDYYKRIQSFVLFYMALEKPIFSAINGTATNNGLSLALLGDEVFYSDNSKFIIDKEEPTLLLGTTSIPERVTVRNGTLKIKGVETGKESMMEEAFAWTKQLQNISYHRARKKKFPDLERVLLQEEIDFLDFYLWCEGCAQQQRP
jgi:enoyl-CoA hydratase/carnithine racemase